ncbi:MAG: hypothetical protein WD336_06255 [Trueperaceae bacterium]
MTILDVLRDVLLAHLAWQRDRGDAAGFVVTTQDGRTVAPFRFGEASVRRTLAAARIVGPVSPYDLRHTVGSLHVRAGTVLKVVSETMRHASIQQAANVYEHFSVDVTAGTVVDGRIARGPWPLGAHDARCPVGVYGGGCDRNVPFGVARAWAERLGQARLVPMPGEGHVSVLPAVAQRVLASVA